MNGDVLVLSTFQQVRFWGPLAYLTPPVLLFHVPLAATVLVVASYTLRRRRGSLSNGRGCSICYSVLVWRWPSSRWVCGCSLGRYCRFFSARQVKRPAAMTRQLRTGSSTLLARLASCSPPSAPTRSPYGVLDGISPADKPSIPRRIRN